MTLIGLLVNRTTLFYGTLPVKPLPFDHYISPSSRITFWWLLRGCEDWQCCRKDSAHESSNICSHYRYNCHSMPCTRTIRQCMTVLTYRSGIPLSAAALRIISHRIVRQLVSCKPSCESIDEPPDIRRRSTWPSCKLRTLSGWHRLCCKKHSDWTSRRW